MNAQFAAGNITFQVALNSFADMTNEEFRFKMMGYLNDASTAFGSPNRSPYLVTATPPDTQDWRQTNPNPVTAVKNQGQCGSCWAFSTTGSTEGATSLAQSKVAVGLSEQNLMDCSKRQGNLGCSGGLMDQAFEYIISNGGIDTEASYPYTAKNGKVCKYSARNKGASISSYKDIIKGSESDLQNAVGLIGPVSIAIDASHNSFQFYSSGVYNEPRCSSTQLDHGVLAVGYGVDNGTDYWLVKNSWGTDWGMQGYIEMSRNANNQCGVATAASYPIV